MQTRKALGIAVGIAASFIAFVSIIVIMVNLGIVGPTVAKLMLVALLGLYVGFGVLIAIYRLIVKLE